MRVARRTGDGEELVGCVRVEPYRLGNRLDEGIPVEKGHERDIHRAERKDVWKEVIEHHPEVAEIFELVGRATERATQRQPPGVLVRETLDQHRRDEATLRRPCYEHLVRGMRRHLVEVLHQRIQVISRLFDRIAVLAVAAGSEGEAQRKEPIGHKLSVDRQLADRQRQRLLRRDVAVRVYHQLAVPLGRDADANPLSAERAVLAGRLCV
jgi:hypothetical protein